MRAFFLVAALAAFSPLSALANGYETIRDKSTFLSVVAGKELRIGLYNLSLNLTPDGKITGRALGWGITGTWQWKDGYFCRDMDWSGSLIPYNCQLVEVRDNREIRFTSDKGAGDSASLRLR